VFSFTEEIFSALNNKMHVVQISCGFTKAFDYVNHELLLSKLNFMDFKILLVSDLYHTFITESTSGNKYTKFK
jgi:hypothetical protein